MGNEAKRVTLRLENITKGYFAKDKKTDVIAPISFDVYDNEFLVILGPGLCGKSVLLNIIAGIEQPDTGQIRIDGKAPSDAECRIGMVFQKLALMPWKTVMENVEIGLKLEGMKKKERREICQKYIDLVGLQGFENAYPSQLSGGMKQRVGIARAYAVNPVILIMDEPFGQLDAQTRYLMEDEILKIWEKEKRTVIFVTNNIEEALYLGDRIILLEKRPAKIQEIFDIAIKRPRDMMDEDFIRQRAEISEKMDLAL